MLVKALPFVHVLWLVNFISAFFGTDTVALAFSLAHFAASLLASLYASLAGSLAHFLVAFVHAAGGHPVIVPAAGGILLLARPHIALFPKMGKRHL